MKVSPKKPPPISSPSSPVVYREEKKILLKHDNYLVYDEVIGTGTYSKVYLGLDIVKNIKVAVK